MSNIEKYFVKKGDCIFSVAQLFGYSDWKLIYNYSKNSSLKKRRPDPSVLHEGDIIYLPKKKRKFVNVSVCEKHTFRHLNYLTTISIQFDSSVLIDLDCNYKLEVKDTSYCIESNFIKGLLSVKIPLISKYAVLNIIDKDNKYYRTIDLNIGGICPIHTLSGVQGRLRSLGYNPGNTDGIWGRKVRLAIISFQNTMSVKDSNEPYGEATELAIEKETGF